MKNLFLLLMTVLFIGCVGKFPTEFNNIRSSDVRVLDFMYEPADAAPGDTVVVKAVFGGKRITLPDVKWKTSFNVTNYLYGIIDKALNINPINVVPIEEKFSDNTTCIKFTFEIPANIMYNSTSIPEDWITVLPKDVRSKIPASFSKLSKAKMLSVIDSLMKLDPKTIKKLAENDTSLNITLQLMCQLLTVKVRLIADVKNTYQTISDYSVRYNSRLKETGLVYVNNNPVIDSLGIYKVPGKRKNYSPSENIHEFIRLDVPKDQEKTILIDKEYSYFVKVFSKNYDTLKTIDGKRQLEQFFTLWLYQLDDAEIQDLTLNKFMHLEGDLLMATLIPPSDEKIKKFTIWCQVADGREGLVTNEVNRPIGSSLIEGHGRFAYMK